jgi:hypothetical protein
MNPQNWSNTILNNRYQKADIREGAGLIRACLANKSKIRRGERSNPSVPKSTSEREAHHELPLPFEAA